jgi:hypothetical protein
MGAAAEPLICWRAPQFCCCAPLRIYQTKLGLDYDYKVYYITAAPWYFEHPSIKALSLLSAYYPLQHPNSFNPRAFGCSVIRYTRPRADYRNRTTRRNPSHWDQPIGPAGLYHSCLHRGAGSSRPISSTPSNDTWLRSSSRSAPRDPAEEVH